MATENEARDVFLTGLRNAHAMEKQALAIINPQLGRIENYPDVKQRLEEHRMETGRQAERLEQLLKGYGDGPSGLKDAALSVVGTMAALGHTPAPDEILKNSFANFAFENYEIAAYNSLITLAEATGDANAVAVLRQNLEEERSMASWLESNLPSVTERYLAKREAGDTAKH